MQKILEDIPLNPLDYGFGDLFMQPVRRNALGEYFIEGYDVFDRRRFDCKSASIHIQSYLKNEHGINTELRFGADEHSLWGGTHCYLSASDGTVIDITPPYHLSEPKHNPIGILSSRRIDEEKTKTALQILPGQRPLATYQHGASLYISKLGPSTPQRSITNHIDRFRYTVTKFQHALPVQELRVGYFSHLTLNDLAAASIEENLDYGDWHRIALVNDLPTKKGRTIVPEDLEAIAKRDQHTIHAFINNMLNPLKRNY